MIQYFKGSDDPATAVFWRDYSGALVDFSPVGYTYVAKVGTVDLATTSFTKSTGFVGAVGSLTANPQVPNIVITWAAAGELNTITAGIYLCQVTATLSGRDRKLQFLIDVKGVLT